MSIFPRMHNGVGFVYLSGGMCAENGISLWGFLSGGTKLCTEQGVYCVTKWDLFPNQSLIMENNHLLFQSVRRYFLPKRTEVSPGQEAQLVGALSYTPKCCGFNPRSERVWEATNQCFSLSISPSLPVSLKSIINK